MMDTAEEVPQMPLDDSGGGGGGGGGSGDAGKGGGSDILDAGGEGGVVDSSSSSSSSSSDHVDMSKWIMGCLYSLYNTFFTLFLFSLYFLVIYFLPIVFSYLFGVSIDYEQMSNEGVFVKRMFSLNNSNNNNNNEDDPRHPQKTLVAMYRDYISSMPYDKSNMDCIDLASMMDAWKREMEREEEEEEEDDEEKRRKRNAHSSSSGNGSSNSQNDNDLKNACGAALNVADSCDHLGTILDPYHPEPFTSPGGGVGGVGGDDEEEKEEEEEDPFVRSVKDRMTTFLYSARYLKTNKHGKKVLSSIFI